MFPLYSNIPRRQQPVIVQRLIVLNVLVFLVEALLPEAYLEQLLYLFGLVPARYGFPEWAGAAGLSSDAYWPFLTNMFLHGDGLHLFTNMWTLWIFGTHVEESMGKWRFLVFYLFCGIIAALTHLLINSDSTIPAIGASGAISGVMAAFAYLYPHGKIIFLVPLLFFPFFIDLPAFVYIAFWFAMQLYNGTLVLSISPGAAGIAFWAHIGGFIAGAVLQRFFVRRYYTGTTRWLEI